MSLDPSVFLLEGEEEMYEKLKKYAYGRCGGDLDEGLLDLFICIKITDEEKRDRACRAMVRIVPEILGTYLQYIDMSWDNIRSFSKCTNFDDVKRNMEYLINGDV